MKYFKIFCFLGLIASAMSYPPNRSISQNTYKPTNNLDSILAAKKAIFEQRAAEAQQKVAAAQKATKQTNKEFQSFNNQ
jgi:uncharacterized membrane protein YgaE (UPF0421/DUF939 family)